MKMTNLEIYTNAQALNEAFTDGTQYLPVKANFFIQKNKAELISLAQDIDNARLNIVRNYGELNEDETSFIVPEEKLDEANRELNDLFALEQEVNIRTIDINAFPDDIVLTTQQMEALMFMID